MPTGVRTPVESISILAFIGIVQAFVTPGICIFVIHFFDQFFPRHTRPPLLFILENDRCFHHRKRRRVGGGIGAARLAEYPLDLRKRHKNLVLYLQKIRRLRNRYARQRRGHIKNVALVQWRHKFRTELKIHRNGY